jgi:hypothetical protein
LESREQKFISAFWISTFSFLTDSFLLSRFLLSVFLVTTLRAGQFAGPFGSARRSTDCVYVLLSHTPRRNREIKTRFPLSKAEIAKAESRNQFQLSQFPLSAFPAALHPKTFVRFLNSSIYRP